MSIDKRLKRLRRSMMFLNAQRPGLLKDAYVYRPDCLLLDLEDAVAENQKDAARFSLYNALKSVDYRGVERIVRINALDTPHWQEDIRVSVAGGADGIRIAKCETAEDVKTVVKHIEKAEEEFGRELGSTLVMAALESPLAIINAYAICTACPRRMIGVAISGGDYRKSMQAEFSPDGIGNGCRKIEHAHCGSRRSCVSDTVFADLDDMEGFRRRSSWSKMSFDRRALSVRGRSPLYMRYLLPPTGRFAKRSALCAPLESRRLRE